MSRFTNIIFLILTILCLYSSIRVYNSYRQQYYVLSDFNNPTTQLRPDAYVNSIESDYPNLSLTSLSLKAIKGNYYLYNDSISKGLKFINQSISERSNPYIMFSEATKAKLYFAMGEIDSAHYYSRKAFKGLSRNPFHFAEFTRTLAIQKKYDSISYYFEKIKDNYDNQVWKVYLAAMNNYIQDTDNQQYVKNYASEALRYFSNDESIRVVSLYILYGQELTKRSLEIEKEAFNDFQNLNYLAALDKYLEADKITPANPINKQNIAFTYFNLKQWDSTEVYLDKLEKMKLLDSYQNYTYGLTLINQKKFSSACKRLKMALDEGLIQAKEFMLSSNCIIN
tara:strand:+ start:5464 stop:6480 length:1017 start_codon:yes stop_codon:yes gene_type:complete